MKRATAAVALAAMVIGLVPAAASASGRKRNTQRRSETPAATAHAPAHGEVGAGLRRQVLAHRPAPAPAPASQRPQHRQRAMPSHQQRPMMPPPPARRSNLGQRVFAAVGVGVAAVGMGVLIAAGFAGLGSAAPIAAVIGIPAILLLTGAVALVSGAMDGPTSPYGVSDPRNVLRAAAFQQQRRRTQAMGGSNFPAPPQF